MCDYHRINKIYVGIVWAMPVRRKSVYCREMLNGCIRNDLRVST